MCLTSIGLTGQDASEPAAGRTRKACNRGNTQPVCVTCLTSRTYVEQTPPPPPVVVSFATSASLGLKSTKKVKFGTKKKFMKLTAKAFTASATVKAPKKT